MTDEIEAPAEPGLFPQTVGERLRAARLAQKLDLADIAQRTRIPLRHLEAIEAGDYSGLPTATYAVGFAKAYARAVGEDEAQVARDVRGRVEDTVRRPEYQPYETDDPARSPSAGVMIGAIVLALILLIGAGLWYGTTLFRGDGMDDPAPIEAEGFAPNNAADLAAVTAAPAGSQVTLVANDQVWVRVYDAGGTTLVERTLAAGERYDVPADANGPMINVGRPDKLQVLVNGSAVPSLGDGRVAIKDVGISAAALQARVTPPAPTPSATSSPAAAPSPRATSSPRAAPSPGRTVPPFFRNPAPEPTSLPNTAAPAPAPTAAAPGNTTGE